MRFIPLSLVTLISLSLLSMAPARAGQSEDAVNKFFLDYQKRVQAAKDMTELTPYLSKNRVEQITRDRAKLPPAEFKMMFEMVKMMMPTKCQIVKTEINGDDCNIQCTADGSADPIFGAMKQAGKTKETTTGNIHLVKESGNWKLEKESWKSSIVSSDGATSLDATSTSTATSTSDVTSTSDTPSTSDVTSKSDASTVNGVTVSGGEVSPNPGTDK